MVGGQETTTNLIGNGLLTLLRNPDQLARLRADPALMPAAVEELLRYESPSQHTARLAPDDVELGGKQIRKRQAVIAVMARRQPRPRALPRPRPARPRPHRQPPPRLRLGRATSASARRWPAWRPDRLRVAAARLPDLELTDEPLVWRENLGLRGLKAAAPDVPEPMTRTKTATPSPRRPCSDAADVRRTIPRSSLESVFFPDSLPPATAAEPLRRQPAVAAAAATPGRSGGCWRTEPAGSSAR